MPSDNRYDSAPFVLNFRSLCDGICNHLDIEHGSGYGVRSMYGHLQQRSVLWLQQVRRHSQLQATIWLELLTLLFGLQGDIKKVRIAVCAGIAVPLVRCIVVGLPLLGMRLLRPPRKPCNNISILSLFQSIHVPLILSWLLPCPALSSCPTLPGVPGLSPPILPCLADLSYHPALPCLTCLVCHYTVSCLPYLATLTWPSALPLCPSPPAGLPGRLICPSPTAYPVLLS